MRKIEFECLKINLEISNVNNACMLESTLKFDSSKKESGMVAIFLALAEIIRALCISRVEIN